MTEALQQEIRTLKNIFESERDPEGRVFAPLADAFRRAGEIQQAVRLLSEGLARHPQFVPGHVVAAQLYAEQGLAEEATIAARNALALDEENVNALRSLLLVLDERSDPEADAVRSRLGALDPEASFGEGGAASAVQRRPVEQVSATDGVEAEPTDRDDGVAAETIETAVSEIDDASFPLEATSGLEDVTLDPPGVAEGATPESEAWRDLEPDLAGEEPVIDLDLLSPVGPDDGAEDAFGMAGLAPELDVESVEEPVIDLDSLAPVSADETGEDAVDLLDLAPGPDVDLPTAEPVIDLDDLAPLAADEDEGVMSLSDLAPDSASEGEEEEEVVSMADLAPDATEPVMDLADLAPAVEPPSDEDVVSLGDLAPDEEEPVALADLAPDEEESVDLADLAPDPEPAEAVFDLADLAPEPAVDEDAVDLADLAPTAEAEPEAGTVDLADLAPDSTEPVMDLADLAPEAEATEEAVDLVDLEPEPEAEAEVTEVTMDLADLAPDSAPEPEEQPDITVMDLVDRTHDDAGAEVAEVVESDDVVIDLDALIAARVSAADDMEAESEEEDAEEAVAAEAPTETHDAPDDDGGPGEPVYTRTLAELYVKQGAVDQAIEVYRQLSEFSPGDADIARRLAELESGEGLEDVGDGSMDTDEEVETLARELAEGGHGEHDIDSPFAWAGEEDRAVEEAESGPTIGDYFEGLLNWKPGEKP